MHLTVLAVPGCPNVKLLEQRLTSPLRSPHPGADGEPRAARLILQARVYVDAGKNQIDDAL